MTLALSLSVCLPGKKPQPISSDGDPRNHVDFTAGSYTARLFSLTTSARRCTRVCSETTSTSLGCTILVWEPRLMTNRSVASLLR